MLLHRMMPLQGDIVDAGLDFHAGIAVGTYTGSTIDKIINDLKVMTINSDANTLTACLVIGDISSCRCPLPDPTTSVFYTF